MKINEISIIEKRRNPEHPAQKATRVSVDTALKKYAGKDYFLTFSDLPKTGLNPNSPYDTPIGIYAYPMVSFPDIWTTKLYKIFPFAANRPFIYILKEKIKPLQNMAEYTDLNWRKDKQKLAELTGNTPEEIEKNTRL